MPAKVMQPPQKQPQSTSTDERLELRAAPPAAPAILVRARDAGSVEATQHFGYSCIIRSYAPRGDILQKVMPPPQKQSQSTSGAADAKKDDPPPAPPASPVGPVRARAAGTATHTNTLQTTTYNKQALEKRNLENRITCKHSHNPTVDMVGAAI